MKQPVCGPSGWLPLGAAIACLAALSHGCDSGRPVVPGGLDIALQDLSRADIRENDTGQQQDGKAWAVPGTWVTIEPGMFLMGSPSSEKCRNNDETQHAVTLTTRFEMMTTEVTQSQFTKVMGYNPSYFKYCGANCPVDKVGWDEAAKYANELSRKFGKAACYFCEGKQPWNLSCSQANGFIGDMIYRCPGYRLPTEAEWEYAFRAGTKTSIYNGDVTRCKETDPKLMEIGWFCDNSTVSYKGCADLSDSGVSCASKCMGTHPVGKKKPNAWGLYDMAGNLKEWCHDYYRTYSKKSEVNPVGMKNSALVFRGGSWDNYHTRAAEREKWSLYYPNPSKRGAANDGFRLVRSIGF